MNINRNTEATKLKITKARVERTFNLNEFQIVCLYKQGHSIEEIRSAAKVRHEKISNILKSRKVKFHCCPHTFSTDGHVQSQKECAHRYYLRHKEKVRSLNNKWKENNLTKTAEYSRKSYGKHRDEILAKKKQWFNDRPGIRDAQNIARKTPLSTECEFCGSTENLHRHHPDYAYPSIFVTCCARCHVYLNNQRIMEVIQ